MAIFHCKMLVHQRVNVAFFSGYDGDEDPRPPSGINDGLNLLGVYVGICVTVFVSIAMASSTQLALPVPERNSMLAAMAFLTPVKDWGTESMECSCIYFPTCQVRVPRFYLSLCSSLCLPPSFFLLPASSPAQRYGKLASSLGPGNARERCQITDNGDGERDNMSG